MLSSVLLVLWAAVSLVQAVDVYLSPSSSFLRSNLSPDQASAVLSRHLGLELLEPFRDASSWAIQEEGFVGQGTRNAFLLTGDESDVLAILPHSLSRAFNSEQPASAKIISLSSVISTYLHRASQAYDSIYSSFDFGDLSDVASLASFLETAEEPLLATVELAKLHEIGKALGQSSEEYRRVVEELRALLERLVGDDRFNIAILTFAAPSPSVEKRQQPKQTQAPLPPNIPAPQLPIGGVSTCFSTLDTCNNGTSSCSGRGECIEASKAGRTCFVCSCGVTKIGEGDQTKTVSWAGESCERRDISGPFVLISGTVVAMILTIFGAVTLLYSVGNQPLPSTLLATAVTVKKD